MSHSHLYGLPKTHKPTLSMRPILSASGTYNYKLAKWLDEKLKPLQQVNLRIRAFYFIFKVTPICATRSALSKQWFIVQRNCPLRISHSPMNVSI